MRTHEAFEGIARRANCSRRVAGRASASDAGAHRTTTAGCPARAEAGSGGHATPARRHGCATCKPGLRRPADRLQQGGNMTTERSELEQRRDELTRSLPGLSDRRADSYRRNSDALARDRAGVRHEQPDEMMRLAKAELVANEAIRDAQRELRDLDTEIKLAPRAGVGSRLRRALSRERRSAAQ